MAILGHSLIDMNLQFPLVWLLIIALLYEDESRVLVLSPRYYRTGMIALLGGLILALYMALPAYQFANNNYKEAIDYYPYYTEAYRQYLSRDVDLEEALPYAQALENLNPYVTVAYEVLRDEAIEREAYEEALDYSKKKVIYSPLLIENHVQYSHALILAATYWHAYGEDEKAKIPLQEILQIPGDLDRLAKEKNTDYNVKHKPDLKMNDALMKDYIEAGYLMDEIMRGQ